MSRHTGGNHAVLTEAQQLQKPLAVMCVCNHGGYEILSYKYNDGNEFVEVVQNDGEKRIGLGYRKITYTAKGRAFFKMFGLRYYLDEFIRI